MALQKIDHVRKAYERLVISNITTAPSPDEIKIALERLEDMMNEFRSRNICSTWVFEDDPLPNTDSNLELEYNYAVETNLAKRLCDLFGKVPTQELMMGASQSLSNWSARSSRTNQIDYPDRQPRGSGTTFRLPRWLRYYRIEGNAPISCDSFEIKVEEEDFYSIDFSNYLLAGSTITSYEVDMKYADGLRLLEDAIDGSAITLKLRGHRAGTQRVVITVDTSAGRVNPESIYFTVTDS